MTTPSGHDRFVWRMVGLALDEDGDLDLRRVGDPVSDEDRLALMNARRLLMEITDDSPFSAFEHEYERWLDALRAAQQAVQDEGLAPAVVSGLQRSLDALLSALRRFDDRTRRQLSQRYGKQSTHFAEFTKSLSDEYDGNFAYRFYVRLRNYSQHSGAPIQNVRAASTQCSDGSIEHAMSAVFNSDFLLANYDGWSGIASHLATLDGDFAVTPIIDSLRGSCQRIHARTLLSQADAINAAIDATVAMADRVPVELGAPYVLGASPALGPLHLPRTQVELLGVDLDVAMRAEIALTWATDLLRGA